MNRKSTSIIRNPILNDFIYTILFNAPYDKKRLLKGKYLKASIYEKSARSFVTHSTRDEKEYILSTLGYEFFYVISKRDETLKSMKDLLSKFENKKQVSAIKDMADMGLFVTSDREFVRLLGLMAKAVHHPSFFLNLEMLRQGYNIKKWGKRLHSTPDLQVREADENSRYVARTILQTSIQMDYVPGALGIPKTAMKILLYLYQHMMADVAYQTLLAYFDGNMTKTELTYAVKELKTQLCISENSDKEYSISSEGIKKVNLFFDQVIKWTNL